LLRASAVVLLWREGYVEPLAPPPKLLHVVAQQLMTLVLQQGGIGRSAWREWLLHLLPSMQLTEEDVESALTHMLSRQILVQDGGILGMGPEGERLCGGKNFMDLLPVFDTPPLFTVFNGTRDLGAVHPISFHRSDGEPAILSRGGRSWEVTHVDFANKTAQVITSEYRGRSRWLGESRPLSYEICQAIRRVLLGDGPSELWSRRAVTEMARAREETICVAPDALVVEVEREKGRTTWWTFSGLVANYGISCSFADIGGHFDNLSVTVSQALSQTEFPERLNVASADRTRQPDEYGEVKFQECLSDELLAAMRAARFSDPRAEEATKQASLRHRSVI
jgi:ATP-dependent Lhr-like helicase